MAACIMAALAGGLVVGWLDRSATEVQGPLLVLMAVAFLVALPRIAPAWAVAITATAGLPLAHIAGRALGDATGASWGMLVAVIPASIAAYVGAGIGSAMRNASADVDRRVLIGAVLLGCAVIGIGPVYATFVARGQPFAGWLATIWQLGSLVAWAVGSPIVIRVWRHIHDRENATARNELATHALIILGVAASHSLLAPLVTRALFIPLGTSSIVGSAAWALVAYLPLDTLTYLSVCSAAYASDVDRRARALAAREAAVRGELAVAQLASLRAQLRPHFLFNALNTASVLAARGDGDGTRRVLTALGELLRYVMRGTEHPEHPNQGMVALRDEIAFIEQYLNVERERFPERLKTTVDIAPDLESVLVPALLLQPLVENAIIHGVGGRIGAGNVSVRGWRENDTLRLSVEDDGPGLTAVPNASPNGIGLANTRARLALLYGSSGKLSLEPRAGGGTVATMTLPLRTPP
jgi:signal transduction histidine kinase